MSITNKQRYHVVDALRGFAIMGILLLHAIEHFNFYIYPDNATQSKFMLFLNQEVWDILFLIFSNKTYTIFALLFGFTFHLQYAKQEAKGFDFGPRFLWRMVLLFGFGWINAILFPGEILLMYAVLSPILFFVRKLNDKALLIVAIALLLQPLFLYFTAQTLIHPNYVVPKPNSGELWVKVIASLNSGNFLEMIQKSHFGALGSFYWSLNNGRIEQTMGLFVLGLYFGRKNLFFNTKVSLRFWKKVLVGAIISFIVLSLIATELAVFNTVLTCWKNLSQTLMTVALFVLFFFTTSTFRALTKPLYAYGRMSLSNYILQSLVGGFIFYPYGLGLANIANVTYSFLIGLGLVILFIIFCNLWMKRYQKGLLEKLWHKLTWISF